MKEFRDEIIAAQKARTDLIKWKLVLVSALGATGLGLNAGKTGELPHVDLVLCCIPFVCAYIDLLCRHYSLRILVIGQFIRTARSDDKEDKVLIDYERFVDKKRDAFGLEDWVLQYSSYLLSFAVLAYGAFFVKTQQSWFISAGAIGVLLTLLISIKFKLYNEFVKEPVTEHLAEGLNIGSPTRHGSPGS